LVFTRPDAQLIQAVGGRQRPPLAGEWAEGRSPPQREGAVVESDGAMRLGRLRLAQELLEPDRVDLAGGRVEQVPGARRDDRRVAERRAQPVHIGEHSVRGGGRGVPVGPQHLDEAIGPDEPPGLGEQRGEQPLLLAPTDRHESLAIAHLGRPEHAVPHPSTSHREQYVHHADQG
jgi:hypothetical protein